MSLLIINQIIVVSYNACFHYTQLTDRVHTNTSHHRVLSLLIINQIIVVSYNACFHCTKLTDRVHTNTSQ